MTVADRQKKLSGGSAISASARRWLWAAVFLMILSADMILNHCSGQTVYVPTHHRVYDYLDRMETKGLLKTVRNNTRPMTRLELAEQMALLLPAQSILSKTDRQQLNFLMVEFSEELLRLKVPKPEKSTSLTRLTRHRWIDPWLPDMFYANGRNFLYFDLQPVKVYLDPVLIRSRLYAQADTLTGQERVFSNTNGWTLWGTIGEHVGFLTDVRDTQEWGTRDYSGIDNFTREGLGFIRSSGKQIDHDETRSHLSFHWKYLTLQYGKDVNRWGPGYRGQLAISDHATSYDEIKLQIRGRHFTFTGLWAVLQHYTPEFFFGGHEEKYLAAHRLELSPWPCIDIGVHEMVIYTGRQFEPSYLNPFMFLRSAEHYLGDRDNAAMGLDVELKIFPKTKIYAELFIDDITTGRLGTGYYANKYAYLAGLYHVDLLGLDNLDLRMEYARIRPFTYTHDGLTNFQHYSTNLGHRLGPNAEEWYLDLKYQYSQPFYLQGFVAVERHGANSTHTNYGGSLFHPWQYGYGEQFDFLGGILRQTTTFSVLGSYEFLCNAFIQLQYRYSDAGSDWPGVDVNYPGRRSEFFVRLTLNE